MMPRFLYVYYFSTNSRMRFFLSKNTVEFIPWTQFGIINSTRRRPKWGAKIQLKRTALLSPIYLHNVLCLFRENKTVESEYTYLRFQFQQTSSQQKKINLLWWVGLANVVLSALNIRTLLRHCFPHSYTRRQSIM